ncbi:MAG: hypothetical protein GF313_00710 [Caldithrix sp.]|nr:hypothetical protein [Caldithrix sp.]
MEKLKIGVVGAGSIAQIIHIPILLNREDVELTAVCDIDDNKVSMLTEKFDIPRGYEVLDDMIREENLDALHICTTSFYHYPMSYLALNNNIHVLIEKPVALNTQDAIKLNKLAKSKKLTAMVGMHNRFREDVLTLREFIRNHELGKLFYIKSGWLKKWTQNPIQSWQGKKNYAGGGAMIDMGLPMIDLCLFVLNYPKIHSVRLYNYHLNPEIQVEDSAFAIIRTTDDITFTIEVSWRMHTDKDLVYSHFFGNKGSAYLNPLRVQKELHGKLVNVTPFEENTHRDRYIRAYEKEIDHFIRVVRGHVQNQSTVQDAINAMQIIDALYQSAETGQEIILNE